MTTAQWGVGTYKQSGAFDGMLAIVINVFVSIDCLVWVHLHYFIFIGLFRVLRVVVLSSNFEHTYTCKFKLKHIF